jgi:hypothetical protein
MLLGNKTNIGLCISFPLNSDIVDFYRLNYTQFLFFSFILFYDILVAGDVRQ